MFKNAIQRTLKICNLAMASEILDLDYALEQLVAHLHINIKINANFSKAD